MDQPVELNDITGQNVRVDDGDGYETPHTFANNEYETLKINTSSTENKYASLKINTLADTTSTISGSPIGTVDGFDVSKPKFDAATFRRLRIAFVIVCIVLLALVIISSVTIGVLVHKLNEHTSCQATSCPDYTTSSGVKTSTSSGVQTSTPSGMNTSTPSGQACPDPGFPAGGKMRANSLADQSIVIFESSSSDECSPNCGDDPNGITEATCDEATRRCLFGCRENYTGDQCDRCIRGKTGDQCQYDCDYNCQNCSWDNFGNATVCNRCKLNFYMETNQCEACSDHCKGNLSSNGPVCRHDDGVCLLGCEDGHYGLRCDKQCSISCQVNSTSDLPICSPVDGACTFGCDNSSYLADCFGNCSHCAQGNASDIRACDETDGHCEFGCENGYYGLKCDKQCNNNCLVNSASVMPTCDRLDGTCTFGCRNTYYGPRCDKRCNNKCNGSLCERDGVCSVGCSFLILGGPKCDQSCPRGCAMRECDQHFTCVFGCFNGKYGHTCSEACPENCKDAVCNQTTGKCLNKCNKGYYGDYCNSTCSSDCPGNNCYPDNGTCKAEDCLVTQHAWYGPSCDTRCPRYCQNKVCHRDSGHCLHGCITGFTGEICDTVVCPSTCAKLSANDTSMTCNNTTAACLNGCLEHFEGDRCDRCERGKTGPQCDIDCDYNCQICSLKKRIGVYTCEICLPGYYFFNRNCEQCRSTCLRLNTTYTCDQNYGTCLYGCKDGWHGEMCDMSCHPFCINRTCSRHDGCCTEGCKYDMFGGCVCMTRCNSNCVEGTCYQNETCSQGCELNTWGADCNQTCSENCLDANDNSMSVCNRDGECIFGCKRGWTGNQCRYQCDYNCRICTWENATGAVTVGCDHCRSGYFYQHNICEQCRITCLQNLTSDLPVCDPTDGVCSFGCADQWFGDQCDKQCSSLCGGSQTCDRHSGCCTEGCRDETYGGCKCATPCNSNCERGTCFQNETCSQGCELNSWGSYCNLTCSENCLGTDNNSTSICNRAGECMFGCKRGWTGNHCLYQCDYNCRICAWNTVTGAVTVGCDHCWPGFFHRHNICEQCRITCLQNFTSNLPICDSNDGNCSFGCADQWFGSQCDKQCSPLCGGSQTCDRHSGCCTEGCRDETYGGCKCTTPCNSNCERGTCFQNETCSQGCELNTWGPYCNQTCSENCLDADNNSTSICNRAGECMFGCKRGWTGNQCQYQCDYNCRICAWDNARGAVTVGCDHCRSGYFYQHNICERCRITCLQNLTSDLPICDSTDGICSFGCSDQWFGDQCDKQCSSLCGGSQTCDRHSGCCTEGCRYDTYGGCNCQKQCNSNCEGGTCYQNETCSQRCKLNTWGSNCSQTCSENCLDADDNSMSVCTRAGECIFGCKRGWTGNQCQYQCDYNCRICAWDNATGAVTVGCEHCRPGYFYQHNICEQCRITCLQNLSSDLPICDPTDGVCSFGCADQWFGDQCDKQCSSLCGGSQTCDRHSGCCTEGCRDETYGGCNCQKQCNSNCEGGTCYQNETCSQRCKLNTWGSNCSQTCSENCLDADDNSMSVCTRAGECMFGCKRGWTGNQCQYQCDYNCRICAWDNATGAVTVGCEHCRPGYFYQHNICEQCRITCLQNLSSDLPICDPTDGVCSFGCADQWFGDQCDKQCSSLCGGSQTCDRHSGCCTEGCRDDTYGGCKCATPCNSNCERGTCFQNEICSQGCKLNAWGPYCNQTCSENCLDTSNNSASICTRAGECMFGCKRGWTGNQCQYQCDYNCGICTWDNATGAVTVGCDHCRSGYFYQHNICERCRITCLQNLTSDLPICDPTDGVCSFGCADQWFGDQCDKQCSSLCGGSQTCDRHSGCCTEGCRDETYGGCNCQKQCNSNCEGGTCYQNETCSQRCKLNTWGSNCSQTCSENCLDADGNSMSVCTRAGECMFGCKRGWTGNQCQYQCDYNCQICTWDNATGAVTVGCDHCRSGYFYQHNICERCRITCLQNLTSDLPICDPTDGVCSFGCADQWFGDQCDKQCSSLCGGSQTCDRHSGCCTEGCRDETYGGCNCQKQCNSNCVEGTCFQNETCSQGCELNTWGDDCNQTCSENCLDADDNLTSVCNRAGECIFCCQDTLTAVTTQSTVPTQQPTTESPTVAKPSNKHYIMGAVGGGAAALIIAIIIITTICVFMRRTQQGSKPSISSTTDEMYRHPFHDNPYAKRMGQRLVMYRTQRSQGGVYPNEPLAHVNYLEYPPARSRDTSRDRYGVYSVG